MQKPIRKVWYKRVWVYIVGGILLVLRFPYCTFISFETGGHLMVGHGEEIKKALVDFMK